MDRDRNAAINIRFKMIYARDNDNKRHPSFGRRPFVPTAPMPFGGDDDGAGVDDDDDDDDTNVVARPAVRVVVGSRTRRTRMRVV